MANTNHVPYLELPSQRVCNTVELLRLIFDNLSASDLTRARKVSWTWRSELERTEWRERMFMDPVQDWEHLIWTEDEVKESPRGCTLSLKQNTPFSALPSDGWSAIITLHPFLAPWALPTEDELYAEIYVDLNENNISEIESLDYTKWPATHVSQPPSTYIRLIWDCVLDKGPFAGRPGNCGFNEDLEKTDGVLLQDIVERIQKRPCIDPNSDDYDHKQALTDIDCELTGLCRIAEKEGCLPDPTKEEWFLSSAHYLEKYGQPTFTLRRLIFVQCVDEDYYLVKAARESPDGTCKV